VARQWLLRHKLLLGLGLVVLTIGLSLAGTLQGLAAYIATMKVSDQRLVELQEAEELRKAVDALAAPADPNASLNEQTTRFRARALAARKQFDTFRDFTAPRPRDADSAAQQAALFQKFADDFDRLKAALDQMDLPRASSEGSPAASQAVADATRELTVCSETLRMSIVADIFHSIAAARKQHHRSMALVLTASGLAVFFLCCLLYFFSSWVFRPIRRLQEGVKRVSEGRFDQPIRLRSGDELQQLADAFDGMTARLRDTYADLARQVEDRSRQLVRSERLVSVGFLAAGVAHEINNPLASIAFCGEALERRLAELLADHPGDAEQARSYVRMIQQEAFRCKDITQRLLEFSRAGERKREPTDLGALVQGVLQIAQHLPNCRGKQIRFEPTAYVVAPANGQEINSVVLNLVVNALDSMDEGGELTIHLGMRDGRAELVFRDTGCGMPEEVLRNIFEPFFTRSRTGKGTGLGLSISHQIIHQHGGEIEASSPGPGRGSVFVVRLPLALAPDEQARRTEAPTLRRAA
jgi:signal transduction histidine kinase